MRARWWLAAASFCAGCAMVLGNTVSLVQPPALGALDGKGCAVKVLPVDVSTFLLDGQLWTEPHAAHALSTFKHRFANGMSSVDPKNLSASSSGKLQARPRLTKATSGRAFKDSASTPSEVVVTLEVLSESGEVLERLEHDVFVDVTARLRGFDDRLAQAGELAGVALGRYLRGQLKCR